MQFQLIAQQLGIDDPAFARQLEAAWDKRLSGISPEARAWLALLPMWTVRLARMCGFPVERDESDRHQADAEPNRPPTEEEDKPMASLVERMRQAGLCQVEPPAWINDKDGRPVLDADPGNLRFSATHLAWSDLVARWSSAEWETLESLLVQICEEIQLLHYYYRIVPEVSVCYAEMAAVAGDSAAAAGRLLDNVQWQLEFGKSSLARLYLTAAVPLAELLRNEMEAALERGKRQVLMFERREADKAFLDKFYRRADQIAAFDELIKGPTERWALHYRGDGGVGKTMLVRYLSADYIPELGASSARIDFDFLNPDYPSRAPGLLLDQFATELRLQDATGKAGREFDQFAEKVLTLHERLSRYTLGGRRQASEEDKLLEDLISTFARAAALLPQPVVLILDTCEELARLRTGGVGPANVLAAFDVLERLQGYLPTLRVVFCGRWPLASAGAGWRAPTAIDLSPRAYLALHEMRGFTEAEAAIYLREQETLAPDLVSPVIKLAAETAPLEFYKWDDSADAPAQVARCNPYKLKMFASWAKRDPEITPEELARLNDGRYIAQRMEDHVREPAVRALLPAAAFLGVFDRETLLAAAGVGEATSGDTFVRLSQQEWMQSESTERLAVNPELRPDLLEYYHGANPAALSVAAGQGLEFLERTTLNLPLDQVSAARFNDTLRLLLENDVARAVSWWQQVEARLAREQAWDWALRLTGQLLSSEGAVAAPLPGVATASGRNLLRAAALSSYAAALLHTDPRSERAAIWNEVADLVRDDSHPLAAKLALRARAGRLAAATRGHTPPEPDLAARFWEALAAADLAKLDEQELCSWIAGVEAVVEWQERLPEQHPAAPGPVLQLAEACSVRSPLLQAAAYDLAGRALVAAGRRAEGVAWLQRATDLDLSAPGQPFLAWHAPEQPRHRALLELIRGAYPGLTPPDQLASQEEVPAAENQDSAALGAAIVALRGAARLPQRDWLERAQSLAVSAVAYDPEVNVHAAYPPLLAVVSEELAALGQVDRGLLLLTGQFQASEAAATQLSHGLALERARLHIVRRMRLQEERSGAFLGGAFLDFTTASELEDYEPRWALDGLEGAGYAAGQIFFPEPPKEDSLRWVHARWRTLYGLQPEHAGAALKWLASTMRGDLPPAEPAFAPSSASQWLDAVEANLLAGKIGAPLPFRLAGTFDPAAWWMAHTDQPEPGLALLLRWHALGGETTVELPRIPSEIPQLLGTRRSAAIALDEAEMLALRLPDRAAPLFGWASEQFHACQDRLAGLQAMTSRCLVLARLRDEEQLVAGLERLQGLYREWSQPEGNGANPPIPPMPAWDELARLSSEPDATGLSALPDTWRPWLLRIIACQAAALGPSSPGFLALLDSLRQHYGEIAYSNGVKGGKEIGYPADLEGVLPEPESVKEQVGGQEVVVGTAKGIEPSPTEPLAGTAPRFRSVRVQETVASKVRQRLGSEKVKVVLNWYDPSGNAVAEDAVSVRPLAYTEAGSQLSASLGRPARELLLAVAGDPAAGLSIELAQRSLASVGWEGVFAAAAAATAAAELAESPWSLLALRTLMDIRRRAVSIWPDPVSCQVWTEGVYIRQQIQDAWQEAGIGSVPSSPRPGSVSPGVHVVHLLGTPKETSAGVRIDLSDSYRSTRALGRLLYAEEVVKSVQDMILCLVQALPVESDRQSATDREQAALLRIYAAELHELGVPTVITIPALPERLLAPVLTPLATAINRPVDGLRPIALAQALKSIREIVQDDLMLPFEDRVNAAWDFCLYGYV